MQNRPMQPQNQNGPTVRRVTDSWRRRSLSTAVQHWKFQFSAVSWLAALAACMVLNLQTATAQTAAVPVGIFEGKNLRK